MLKFLHSFVSPKADGPDSTLVRPSAWNAEHEVTTDSAGGVVIGAPVGQTGQLVELPLAYDQNTQSWMLEGTGMMQPPTGTTAQRPAVPNRGAMRWNLDLSLPEMWDGTTWQPIQIGPTPMITGLVMGWYDVTAPSGWLLLDGSTIGDAGSGATHAAAIYQALFTHLYNLPAGLTVSGGRTVDAATDWGLGKTIVLFNESGLVTAAPEATANYLPANATTPGQVVGVGGANQVAPINIGGYTGQTNTGGQFGVVGSGPATPDHAHYFAWAGNSGAFSVAQKTMIRNSIIKY